MSNNTNMKETQVEIAILAAIDRYNYGDLLFPLILREYLQNIEGVNIGYYGLVDADFESCGSIKTRSFSEFYEQYAKSSQPNIVIIGGGCVIGCQAGKLYSFLRPTPMLNLYSLLSRILHLPDPANAIARKKLNIKWGRYPLCPAKVNDKTLLIYNAVGDKFKPYPDLISNFRDAKYFSVRNSKLYDSLEAVLEKSKLALCPDSATVMSLIWPQEKLRDMASDDVTDILSNHKGGYIVFQAKLKMMRRIKTIKRQLIRLYNETGLPIILLPIGRAHRHEDDVLLNELDRQLDIPTRLANVMHINDVMCLIAHSKLFIGSSLHGNITAMSYAVPHLGIGNISKVDQYLKHWDTEPNKTMGTVSLSRICEGARIVLQQSDKEKLIANAERLSRLSSQSLEDIAAIVNEYCDTQTS